MGTEQPWLDRMRIVLRPGMRALDVGAHEGLYAITMAEAVAPTGCVVAVEPGPKAAAVLREKVAGSPWASIITVREVAVADQSGRRALYQHASETRHHSLAAGNVYPESPASARPCEVDALTLDALLCAPPLSGQVDVVKLDTQGAEGLILRGAPTLLALPHLRVQLELWPAGLARLGSSPKEVCDLLEAAGFTPCGADDVPYTVKRILAMAEACAPSNGYLDLLWVK